jgi:hypothetical protein
MKYKLNSKWNKIVPRTVSAPLYAISIPLGTQKYPRSKKSYAQGLSKGLANIENFFGTPMM